MIVKITIRKPYKSIKEFELDNLPDFVVLTGENGTGKTQLIEYLYHISKVDEKGNYLSGPEGATLLDDELKKLITSDSATPLVDFAPPAIVEMNGARITNIVYRGVQAPTVEVGGKFDWRQLYTAGEMIAQKHLFYKTHESIVPNIAEKSTDELTKAYIESIGFHRGGARLTADTQIPTISQTDIDTIRRIEQDQPEIDYSKDQYLYIAYQPVPPSNVFAANLKFLYVQHWARIQAGLPVNKAPWEIFNDIGKALNFKFELDEPNIEDKKFEVRLRDKAKKVFISPDSLSSGEKVIFSLFVAMYSTHSEAHLPELIILDEPDAYLHPSLSRTLLDVVQKIFVEQHHIKVIMTTHSPSTVALAPKDSIYCMQDGQMVASDKKEAIVSLTTGLNTISVYYENVKQVFVEADNDNTYLTVVKDMAMRAGLLSNEVNLNFVNVGNEVNGGCSIVTKVVKDLADAGNQTVFGVIDWDGHNVDTDRIKVLGQGSRYAIDNYAVDPLVIILICLEEVTWREKIGFDKHDSVTTFKELNNEEQQKYVDAIITELKKKVPANERTDIHSITYQTMEGRNYNIPAWFTQIQGHKLVEYMRAAFPLLNKYSDDRKLYKHIAVNMCYANYPGIIPMDIVDTLKNIQGL